MAHDWEQRKLGDLGNVVTGSTPSTNHREYYGGDYLFVSPADIQDNRDIVRTNTTLTQSGVKHARVLSEGASLFVSIGSTIGKVGQIQSNATTNQQINAIQPNKSTNADFLFSLLEKIAPHLKRISATQAVPILNKSSFSTFSDLVPDAVEQRLVGIILRRLDDTIALHQRKLERLKKIKQALLQKMFV